MRTLTCLCAAAWLASRAVAAESPAVAEHLAEAIRFETVSSSSDVRADAKIFARFHEFIGRTFPRVHRTLGRRSFPSDSLLFTWKGSDASKAPGLLLAHQDVVPVEPGSEGAWTHPPFAGVVADGWVWGRGAMDDKASLIAILEAVESLLAEGFTPRRTVLLGFGSDEEIGGVDGAAGIARELETEGVRLEFVLDEGKTVTRGIVVGIDSPVAEIGIAEKGFLSVGLHVDAEGGHSSRPLAESAIGILAEAVARLECHPLPARVDGSAREMLESLASERPWLDRVRFRNLWLFGPLIARSFAKNPSLQPFVRTTTAPTIFHAGIKENVLPRQADAVVNFRILPGDSIASVLEHVRAVVDNDRVKIARYGRIVSEPSPISSRTSAAYARIERTIRGLYPEARIVPSLVTGATDSRHFSGIADGVYRFMPNSVGPDDLRRFHGVDERMSVAELERAVEFYRRFLKDEERNDSRPVPVDDYPGRP
jgi:carboxypeptidase PM20D1